MGDNLKTEINKVQKEKDITGIIGESVVKQREFKPNEIKIEASGNANVKINVPEAKESYDKSNTGNFGSKSSMDFDFSGTETYSSSWYYLIIAVAFILFLIGIKILMGYFNQLGITGGLKLGASWLGEISNLRKSNVNPEVNVALSQLEAILERKYGSLRQKSKKTS